jgi:hypothetical protein
MLTLRQVLLFQVPLDKLIRKVSISVKKEKRGIQYNTIIDTNNIENYFQVSNLKYDCYDDFPFIDTNSIFGEYLDYFWTKDDIYGEKMKKSLTKALMNKIAREYNIKLRSYNFFKILKLCAKYGVEVKNIDYIEVKQRKMDPIYYITGEDIDKIISKKKPKIIEIIVKMLINYDDKYLMKLIKGQNGPNICRCMLDLVYTGLKVNDFLNNNIEDFNTFQKLLLSVAKSQNEVEYIVNIIQGLMPSIKFIKENIDILLTMDKYCFPINLEPPTDKDDINEIYILVKEILDKSSEKNFKIINLENLFENLMNIALYKDLKVSGQLHNFIPFLSKD